MVPKSHICRSSWQMWAEFVSYAASAPKKAIMSGVMQTHGKRSFAALTVALLFILAVAPVALAHDGPHSAPLMSETAQAFLASLTPEQTQKTVYSFDSDERSNWHFVPMPDRKGLPIKEMAPEQK
ncbi:MAG: DUF3500 domain-containing protein, partial [Candidatus Korobacteraceae bacterium]